MLITSLKLENIRSYKSEEIAFPEGSVMLSGDIGSGKSSILLAIEFALFGTRRKYLSASSLLRKGTNEGAVVLNLELDGKEVSIKRSLKKSKLGIKQEQGYVVVDGKKTTATATELTARMINLVGYPKELTTKSTSPIYCYTVYTPQEEMKQIITEDQDSRLETLRKVFGIDKYKRIRDNTQVFVRHLKSKNQELEIKTEDLEAKKQELKERQGEVNELNEKISLLNPKMEETKKSLSEANKRLRSLEEQEKKLINLKNKRDVLETKIESVNEQLNENKLSQERVGQRIKELEEKIQSFEIKELEETDPSVIEKSISEKEEQINSAKQKKTLLSEKLNNYNKQLLSLKASIKTKQAQLKDFSEKKERLSSIEEKVKEKEEVEVEIRETRKFLDELNLDIKGFELRKEEAENTKQSLADKDACPLCLQAISSDHKHKINDEKDEELKGITLKLDQLHSQGKHKTETMKKLEEEHLRILRYDKQLVQLEVELSNLESINRNLEKKNSELAEITREQELASKELEEVKEIRLEETAKEIINLKTQLKKIQEEKLKLSDKENTENLLANNKEELESCKERGEKLMKSFETLESEQEKIHEEIEKNSELKEEIKQAKKRVEDVNTEKHRLELDQTALSKEKEAAVKIIKSVDEDLKGKLELRKQLDQSKLTLDWLREHFTSLVNVLEKNIMAQLYQEFNALFTEWFDLLMDDEVISARLDETFTPMIEQNGYEVDAVSLSGGEKTSLALAYRLSLNKVINDFITSIKTKDIIILDEPTDGFSTEQLDKIKDVLDQLRVKQSIIVSHEPKIESFVNNVIRVDKQEHISNVSYG